MLPDDKQMVGICDCIDDVDQDLQQSQGYVLKASL